MEVSILKCQGADGAYFNALSTLAAGRFTNRFILEGGDHSLETPSGKTNGSNAQLLLAYPHAFTAEHTLIGIIDKEWTAFIDGKIPLKSPKSLCLEFDTQMFGNFLKFTGSVF